jgi:hypothetical protein
MDSIERCAERQQRSVNNFVAVVLAEIVKPQVRVREKSKMAQHEDAAVS